MSLLRMASPMEREIHNVINEEIVSVELPAPPSWKKLVQILFSQLYLQTSSVILLEQFQVVE